MITIVKLNNKLGIDLSKTNEKIILRLLFFINYLSKYSFIPKFKFIKFKKVLIFQSKCKIISILEKDEINKINDIYKILEDENIKLNFMYNKLPLFRDKYSNQIYFINFLYSYHSSLVKFQIQSNKISNLKNTYILNKYLLHNYNLNIRPNNNINFYIVIFGEFEKNCFYSIIEKFKKLEIKVTFILFVMQKDYSKLVNLISKDIFNKYILIKVDKYIYKPINTLSYLEDIVKMNYDYIMMIDIGNNFDYNRFFKNIIFKTNIIYTSKIYRCIELKFFLKNNYELNKLLQGNNKSIGDYNIVDIDFENIKFKGNLVSKRIFLKNYNKKNYDYNFKNKKYPKYIDLENSIIPKKIFDFFIGINKMLDNKNINNFIGLYVFYNNIKLHCL